MKKLIPLILISFAPLFCSGQAYIPLNLDSSCFWIQDYHYYQGAPYVSVFGEVLQYVEKDTTIGNNVYHKIRGYCTKNASGSASHWYFNWVNCYNPTMYIREDTIVKKIFRIFRFNPLEEEVLLNFDLDTSNKMSHIPPDSNSFALAPIDSIMIKSYFGINRRSIFSTTFTNPDPYIRIEGIGATLNFPDVGSGEWGVPMFTLNTFVRNNNVLFKRDNYPLDSCYHKASKNFLCWPNSISEVSVFSNVFYSINSLYIKEVQEGLNIKLTNLAGQKVFEKEILGKDKISFDYFPSGIYILSLQSAKGIETRKILIR